MAEQHLPTDARYAEAGDKGGSGGRDFRAMPAPRAWIKQFGSSALNELADEALAHNPDLAEAAGRWAEARGRVDVARAALLPRLQGTGSATRQDQGFPNLTGSRNTYMANLEVSWEPDLWGRLRSSTASSEARAQASALDYAYARQSLVAQVASAWFTAIAANRQIEIDRDRLKLEEKTADVADAKRRAGAGSALDAEIALANVGLARQSVAESQNAVKQARRALEILLGRYPAAQVRTATSLADVPGPVPPGLPSQLLERRPDVIAADRRVAAAFHFTAAARAARLPSVTLSASAGTLLDPTEAIWSLGANLLAPIYSGGELQAQVRITRAQERQALAQFVQVGLQAFREAESAMSSERYLRRRQAELAEANEHLSDASDIAQARYDAGVIGILDLTQVRRQYFDTRSQLLRVRAERLRQRVSLYLALGGSFDDGHATDAAEGEPPVDSYTPLPETLLGSIFQTTPSPIPDPGPRGAPPGIAEASATVSSSPSLSPAPKNPSSTQPIRPSVTPQDQAEETP